MADEGNEDSWLYGNTKDDGKEDTAGDNDKNETTDDGQNGTYDEVSDPHWEEMQEDEQKRLNMVQGRFPDDDADQHDDNAMDSSDVNPSRDDAAEREEAFQGEDDSHLQEDESHQREEGPEKPERSDGEMDSEDSDDDDVNVVIRDIKSGPTYSIVKPRGPIVVQQAAQAAPGLDKSKQPAGKFSIEEFESVGTINGVPAHEFSIDSLDEKPWRKPGADITDYFNYGFNEDTWKSYCERQKRMRMHESGVGLQGLTINNPQAAQTQNNWRTGPPPPRKMNGIDVIGGMNMHPRSEGEMMPRHPKENVIQVMTADRREYSRSATKFDPSMGPPPFGAPPDFYHPEPDYGDYGYEPTQESQWNQESNWQPHGIKTLTPGPSQMMPPGMGMPPHMEMMPPPMQPGMNMGPPGMGPPVMRNHDRERERDRERVERERERDRHIRSREREREHRRDRERDRERELSVVKPELMEPERARSEKPERERDPEKEKRSSKTDRHKERYRERSRSREKSKSRRKSRSRDRERDSTSRHSSRADKKKSHRKDKEESE
ncbi:pre-mRNA 3'-end-processing factor FIP1 [Toxorhynchites rutilus septentrionalis]|uniref:pre-mRNA 3'-end-processing factor FIP1 n=1 Tax=Toxorhynchites rutilus septentrionalis TaxID=329112 RepID=UPI00247B268C|nr:pre-mRNA 3'-end-processing factor FIP1 [Toxorhynchites rutilus septentrionalis]